MILSNHQIFEFVTQNKIKKYPKNDKQTILDYKKKKHLTLNNAKKISDKFKGNIVDLETSDNLFYNTIHL